MKIFGSFIGKVVIVFCVALVFGILGNSNVKAAAVGDQLTAPESGWQRIDDRDNNISYIGNWSNISDVATSPYYYKGTGKVNQNDQVAKIRFNFSGTKIRIIGSFYSNYSPNIQIKIDGKIIEKFSENSIKTNINTPYMALVYEKLELTNMVHSVEIEEMSRINPMYLDAIDIDSNGNILPYNEKISVDSSVSSITLNKTTNTLQVGQTDQLTATVTPDDATNKAVTWASSDPTIAIVDSNGNVTAVKEGTATITATTTDGSNLSASCTVNVTTQTNNLILNIEPEKDKIKKNETVSVNLTIDNIKDIAAEDVRIQYDSSKLQFLGMDEVDGVKLVKSDTKDGELRVVVASKGAANIVNAKKTLLKLNFKGIAVGDALVDITKGRVSDGITTEEDLTDEQCGQATITIEDLYDVNNSGEFTLLDLGIDGRHYGEDPSTLAQYNSDVVINNAIDDDDLLKIGEYMLENPNYNF